MLKVDDIMSIHSRGKFTRIYVKIDLFKKLVPRISVLGSELYIEYEALHQIYFSYKKYGHRSDLCSESPENNDLSLKGTASSEACNTLTFKSLYSSNKSMILRWYNSRWSYNT
ncbi:hypothetical protein AHAS_Ahas02G0101300 [Arachis hypogaea]